MIKVDESDPVGELEPSFPYKDITIRRGVDMKEHYELQSEIGRGKFGTVFKCREKATSLMLAAKFVGIVHKQDRRNVEREVEIMCELQHPRLIQLYDAFEANNAMCFILELVEGGELFERVIGDDFVLTEKAVTIFMRQICEGVQFIHSKNILHLDLKPENILCLTKTGNRIKIIDFGLARKFNPENKLQVLFGTPEFVAPEVVNFDAIGFGTDMWSVGVICYVLLSGLSPFMGETDVETMANVTVAQYDFDDEAFDSISNDAKDFIKKLLLKDHKSRPTATECLSHRWMQKKKPKRAVRKSSSKKLIKSAAGEKTKPAAKPAVDVAVEPLDVSKENLKEFCSRSRSQSPAEVATSPSPSLAQLRIQRDCKSSKTGKSDDGPKATEVARGVDGESSQTTSGSPMQTVSGVPCDVPNGPKSTGGERLQTASGEIKTVSVALQNDSGRGLESVKPRTVTDEPKTNETTAPLQSTSDGTQCTSGKIIVHSTSEQLQKKTSDEIETVPVALHSGSGGPVPLPVDRLTQTVPEEPKTPADGSKTNEADAEPQSTSDGIQSTSGQQTKTSDGIRIVPVVLQTISRGPLKPDSSASQTTGGPAQTVPDGSEIVPGDPRTVGNLGILFASGKGLESVSEAPDGLQRRTSWSKTTVTTSAGFRRSSNASFVQFSSFRACTTTVQGPGLPGGLSERLRAALLVDRASQAEGGGSAQEPPADRRPKFKFTNRDVPAGSPPPASNLMYYMQTSKQSSSCRSAPLSKRASPEHESAKEMLLKLFYGDKNAESKLSI